MYFLSCFPNAKLQWFSSTHALHMFLNDSTFLNRAPGVNPARVAEPVKSKTAGSHLQQLEQEQLELDKRLVEQR